MFQCKCGNDELDEIKKRYENHTIHIFPIFYEITVSDLPYQYSWLTDLIYNELNQSTGSLATCKQIVYKMEKMQLKFLEEKLKILMKIILLLALQFYICFMFIFALKI